VEVLFCFYLFYLEDSLKREEFVFCIGYLGGMAIVDKGAKSKYGSLGSMDLLEKGLFRSAFCSALYSGSDDELNAVLAGVNSTIGTSFSSISQLKRLYGVFEVPSDLTKIKVL